MMRPLASAATRTRDFAVAMWRRPFTEPVAGVLALMLLTGFGCASPSAQFTQRAADLGLRAEVVPGTVFQHVVLLRAERPSRTLHIYLDGDGTPWHPWGPASDPTPRNPLVLRLMALDPEPSLYLGRPCYLGFSQTPPCTSALWTTERYSETVVSSMATALSRFLEGTEVDRLVWVGYSGGGTLAMLLAPRFKRTTDLVTIAGNLDIDAWADLHGYARLAGSLNPARLPALPERIHQRHYAGGRDRVVPREVIARGPIDPDAVIVIPTYDHICCWEAIWPTLLVDVDGVSASERRR